MRLPPVQKVKFILGIGSDEDLGDDGRGEVEVVYHGLRLFYQQYIARLGWTAKDPPGDREIAAHAFQLQVASRLAYRLRGAVENPECVEDIDDEAGN